jgi:hypothetical protein
MCEGFDERVLNHITRIFIGTGHASGDAQANGPGGCKDRFSSRFVTRLGETHLIRIDHCGQRRRLVNRWFA